MGPPTARGAASSALCVEGSDTFRSLTLLPCECRCSAMATELSQVQAICRLLFVARLVRVAGICSAAYSSELAQAAGELEEKTLQVESLRSAKCELLLETSAEPAAAPSPCPELPFPISAEQQEAGCPCEYAVLYSTAQNLDEFAFYFACRMPGDRSQHACQPGLKVQQRV